jgi:hypothetical protein
LIEADAKLARLEGISGHFDEASFLLLLHTTLPPHSSNMSSTLNNTPVLALVTGASGLVGAAIALRFLEQGHSVRLPLRRQEQADGWISEYGTKYPGKIETLVLTKSITEEAVFDEAVKGVDVVVHAASPASFAVEVRFPPLLCGRLADSCPLQGTAESAYLNPAIDGTLSILKSAKKTGTVKSFVYTSSSVQFSSPICPLYSLPSLLSEAPLSLPSRTSSLCRTMLSSTSTLGTRPPCAPSFRLPSCHIEADVRPLQYEEAAKLPLEAAGEIYGASFFLLFTLSSFY